MFYLVVLIVEYIVYPYTFDSCPNDNWHGVIMLLLPEKPKVSGTTHQRIASTKKLALPLRMFYSLSCGCPFLCLSRAY